MQQSLYDILINTFAAYGILWALALNLGLELPDRLRNIMKHAVVQVLLLYTAAYIVTRNTLSSVLAVGAHYSMVTIFSEKKETETVSETTQPVEPVNMCSSIGRLSSFE